MSEAAAVSGGNPAATTNTGSGAGSDAGGGSSTATPPASSDWTSAMPEDMRGYIQNKGFKDPNSLADSYRNFEKLMGVPQDRVLKLPEKEDAPEWSQVYDRLGRPKDAKEYEIKSPDGAPPEFSQWAKGTFHELGLSKAQGEKLSAKWNDYMGAEAQKGAQASQAESAQAVSKLKQEWGAAYDQNLNLVDHAALRLSLDAPKLAALRAALGPVEAMKFIHGIATKLGGEPEFVRGGSGQGFGSAMTPEAAKNRIRSLQSDPAFVSRHNAGGSTEREEMTRLHQYAYPELS